MKVYKIKNTYEPGVVVVDIRSILTELFHKTLTKLPGDLFLIFPDSITKTIDPKKLSNLYGATWYGIYKDDKISGVWSALDYLESLAGYTSISIMIEPWISEETLESLKKLQYSGIETSVFNSRDLTREEKEKIYIINPKIIEIAFGFRFKRFGKEDNKGMYSRKTTSDPILFLRPKSIRGIRTNLSPEILHSFYGLSVGSFISSLIPPETYINVRVNEAKI